MKVDIMNTDTDDDDGELIFDDDDSYDRILQGRRVASKSKDGIGGEKGS